MAAGCKKVWTALKIKPTHKTFYCTMQPLEVFFFLIRETCHLSLILKIHNFSNYSEMHICGLCNHGHSCLLVFAPCFCVSYLYQIAHLGDDDEEPEFSSAMPLEEGDTFFFQPRPLKNLVLVDEQENLSPIMSCQVR